MEASQSPLPVAYETQQVVVLSIYLNFKAVVVSKRVYCVCNGTLQCLQGLHMVEEKMS